MRKLAFLFAIILLTVPGISMAVEGIITGPEWESPFVDMDPNDPFDSSDDDLSFTPAEMESGQASPFMTITSATVTFDPKRKDKLILKGTTGSLSLNGATSVIFEAGSFKQEITLDKFTKLKEKYTFKGATGGAGIASLILDMPKGLFSATVQNLFLTGFTNPLPVSLKAGTSSECSMVQFVVKKNKWTFSGRRNPQYGCLISQPPQATPRGLFVNKAKDVKVQAQVPSHPDLNQNSIGLFRVDSNLNILSGPLCSLLDNGILSNGDQMAGDRIFSCIANLQEGTAGKMFLMVGAEWGGKMTYSPSFSLDVVTPYTEQEAQQTMAAQENAGQTWQDNLTKYGDTKKARNETVKAVKKLEGVKAAWVSSDGVHIWIEFKSGIRGGLILSEEGSRAGGTAGPFVEGMAQTLKRRANHPLLTLPTSCKQKSDPGGGTSSVPVGNCDVLIWDYWAPSYDFVDSSAFKSNPSQRFQLAFQYRQYEGEGEYWGCGVNSLREITKYGTVIIKTFGQKGRVSPLYTVNEPVTLPKLQNEQYMLDLLTGCLEVLIDREGKIDFYFTPSFISTLEGQFDKSIVYVEAAYSSELASAFLSKGAHTFFGYSGDDPDIGWMSDTTKKLVTSMVKDGKDTGEAYAAIPERSKGSSYFLWFSSSIDGISYDCGPKKADGRIGVQMNSHVDYQPPNPPPYKYDEERGYRAGGSHPNFTGQFLNNIFKMTWDFNIYGSRLWGEMEVTLDKEPSGATKVISFWAWEQQQELGGEFGYRYMIIQGGNINFTEKTDYLLTFEARGSEVCNYVTAAIGYTSGNKTDGLHEYWFNGFECNNKSYLNIYFEFIK